MNWNLRNRSLDFKRTRVMGILNLTPDSFSDGGNSLDAGLALERAREILAQGADLLDLGGESTRPGALPVDAAEELRRILPVLKKIRTETGVPISIDTTKPEVARACLAEGADIINDVSGLQASGNAMARLVREAGAGLVLMHRRGTPETMQSFASYGDVIEEVFRELAAARDAALEQGIGPDKIVLDPGLGFAKTAEQNLEILRGLERFHEMGQPLLLGPSRKSFIGKVTGRQIHEREFGTAAVCALAVLKKVQILRVHEVGKMRDVINMMEAIEGAGHVRA